MSDECPQRIIFRAFQSADENAVIALWQRAGLLRSWNNPHKDIFRKLQVQSQWFLVAEQKHSIVASVMAGYDGHRGWINYLAVDPVCQGTGTGRQLMSHVEQLLLEFGCPKINLQIRRGNSDAIAFYEKLGYQPDDVVSYGKRLIED